jgi:hypothetical protein
MAQRIEAEPFTGQGDSNRPGQRERVFSRFDRANALIAATRKFAINVLDATQVVVGKLFMTAAALYGLWHLLFKR